ncbi:MAG: TIGR03790 family protein [Deltaproteobacteria bacterium]|nr:TIGR03790 family protein [Deltaproteobacteria bacterium]
MPAQIFSLLLLCFFSVVVPLSTPAEAVLLPEEILVLVNSRTSASVRLGKFYMARRHIPAGHLSALDMPKGEQISRRDYARLIAAPLRKIVRKLRSRGEKIRCIVTTYGVPLRIGPQRPAGVSDGEVRAVRKSVRKKKKAFSVLQKDRKKGSLRRLKEEIRRVNAQLNHLSGRDTVASVDSELALLLSVPYPLAGPRPNPDFLGNREKGGRKKPVLLVSRLDAPTVALARGLVETAIRVEKRGLSGKLYLDARGLRSGKSAYGNYDENIRRTAKILRKAAFPVVLDSRPELFGPGDCPNAALYCGWYSLAEYRDAFTWVRGAVGYHVASAECRSLHGKKGNYWVKRMIEKGVTATLGPVAEPYLAAFPPPSIFFPLLMTGRYTLVEVFALSNPFLSWRMVLIGDPLYTPFKNRPAYFLLTPPPPPA